VSFTSYNVLLIAPRFTAQSFWGLNGACQAVGVGYPATPLGLLTVAALLPRQWAIRLVDRNLEDFTDADFAWADMVMTGGMLPQQPDILHLIEVAHDKGKPIVVGGADPTSSPHIYEAADFRVLGEAEEIISQFIDAWNAGERSGTFTAEKFKTDVSKSPTPRFDLLKRHRYLFVGVQFSRGCPFKCEFCDIIELFGRAPRTKTTGQMLAELDALYDLGYRGHVDFVDDNLVGNKKSLKAFLPALIAWQKKRDYPFILSTEASINLADDQAVLDMMRDANFFGMFVGIESPDDDTLLQMQKKQNLKRSIADGVRKIFQSGLFVMGGFVVGFDSEKGRIGQNIVDFIEDIPIPICFISLLYALPNTQLTRRLAREGRLHEDHDRAPAYATILSTTGLNYETARPRRDILSDFRLILEKIYEPKAYFARVRRMVDHSDFPKGQLRARPHELLRAVRLAASMTMRREYRGEYWRTIAYCLLTKPRAFQMVAAVALFYRHAGPYSRYVMARVDEQLAAMESGAWQEPRALPPRVIAEPEVVAA
jgi:radical SAM superfamily enzyme YgiQ (UPF0313 family)